MRVLSLGTVPGGPRGLYRPQGIAGWRSTLAGTNSHGPGVFKGGLDIVLIGDSITTGLNNEVANTLFRHTGSWSRILTRMLQRRFNPPGIGGWGYLRADIANAAQYMGLGGLGATTRGTANIGLGWDATAATVLRIPSAASKANGFQLRLGPPGSALNATSIDIVYTRWANSPDLIVDINDGSAAGSGNGNIHNSVTVAANASVVRGNRRLVTGIDPRLDAWLQVTSGATGSAELLVDGFIHYCGDYRYGVRLHNLATPGLASDGYSGAARLPLNIDAFSTPAGGTFDTNDPGATRAKLFIVALGTNDMGAGNGGAGYAAMANVATFKARILTIVERILALPTNPDVLLVCHVPPQFPAMWSRGSDLPPAYRTAMREISDQYPTRVAMMDMCDYFGLAYDANAYTTIYGSQPQADNVHIPTNFHGPMARAMYMAITGEYTVQ